MSYVRHIILALLLLFSVATCVRTGTNLGEGERASWRLVAAPPLAQLDTARLNMLMLGHRGLYDDFVAVWAIQFLAEPSLTKIATAESVNNAIRAITRHQVRLESLYLISCFVLALDFNRPEYCEGISVDGLKAFPNSWRIPMTQGFIAAFKQNDNLKAASFLEIAASRPNSPPYVAKVAQKLALKSSASGEDLNETLNMLREVPGGTRIIEVLRERLKNQSTPSQTGVSP